jgi:hypothetical protein
MRTVACPMAAFHPKRTSDFDPKQTLAALLKRVCCPGCLRRLVEGKIHSY